MMQNISHSSLSHHKLSYSSGGLTIFRETLFLAAVYTFILLLTVFRKSESTEAREIPSGETFFLESEFHTLLVKKSGISSFRITFQNAPGRHWKLVR